MLMLLPEIEVYRRSGSLARSYAAFLGVHEEGRGGEEQEDDATDERDGPDGDLLCDHAAAENRQSGAQKVAEEASDDDRGQVLPGGQHDGGQLRSAR